MIINTNVVAQQATDQLAASQTQLSKSLARLSSGRKIIDPSDDAGGLAVATRLDAQIRRVGAAKANVSNAMSYLQTQDGFLQQVAKALSRMSELSIMAQDVTKQSNDLVLYDKEFQTLAAYINDIATKDFNGTSLFSGAVLSVTTDPDPRSGNNFQMTSVSMLAGTPYNLGASNVTTSAAAAIALDSVKSAIGQLAQDRATLGAYQTRLSYTTQQLQMSNENLSAASSRIQDVDVADETTNFARFNILVQAGTAMVAQANTLPQSALRLLPQ